MSILVDNCIWILAGSRQIDALSECAHSIPKRGWEYSKQIHGHQRSALQWL
jgi:hypothetical protein